MSYCRWSDNNFTCDLYCYEDCKGGYTTHIAKYRQRFWVKFIYWLTDRRLDIDNFKIRINRICLWRLPYWIRYKKIHLLEAGNTYNDPTLKEFKCRIEYLIKIGYKVPKYVLECIDDEIDREKGARRPI